MQELYFDLVDCSNLKFVGRAKINQIERLSINSSVDV